MDTYKNTQFSYDALSRAAKIEERTAGSVTSTKQHLWCGSERCEERDLTGGFGSGKQFFARGQRDFNAGSSTNYQFTKDAPPSSIREMTDSSGAIVAQYAYGPYGDVTKVQGTLSADFQYADYYLHVRSGLNLTYYRVYSSINGRWLSRDPLSENAGPNLYSYVSNDPIRWVDHTGLMGCAGGACASGAPVSIPLTMNAAKPRKRQFTPWPEDFAIGRPNEFPFLECQDGTKVRCLRCCHQKFDALHNTKELGAGYCDKMYGPGGCDPDPRKYKCCVLWAVQYLSYCVRRCNGGFTGDTPAVDDEECNDP